MTRERENDRIPPQAAAVIFVMILVDLNFIFAPREVAAVAGRDAWLSVVLAFAVISVSVLLMFRLVRMFPGSFLDEIVRKVLGVSFGTLLVLTYVLLWTVLAAQIIQIQSVLFNHTLLPQTPPVLLSLYVILLSTYLVRHGIEPMARLFVVLVPIFLFTVLALVAAGAPAAEMGRLKPVLAKGPGPLLEGAFVALAYAPGASVVAMIAPFFSRIQGALRATLIGAWTVALSLGVLTMVITARFGVLDITEHLFPTISLVELITLPGFTGLRLDPVFMSVWFLVSFGSITLNHYMASAAIGRLVGAGRARWPVLSVAAVLVGLASIPVSIPDLLSWTLSTRKAVIPVTMIGLPVLILAVAYLRGFAAGEESKGAS